jgi:hypothetical protein
MPDIPIEQAIYGNAEAGGYRFLARSPGFLDDWLPEAERLCTGFGERPAGIACPGAVFARPFGPKHVAVAQVADLGSDDANRPGALGFYVLILPRSGYVEWIGDPFTVADRYPPPWAARGALPTLSWPVESLPRRTVAQVQQALKNGDSPTLLGAVQALIDSGRVVFERSAPAGQLLRDLWLLLPSSSRAELWPASFAFSNDLQFDVLATPRVDPVRFPDYLTEEQAGDYPQGRYELGLQVAAETGDQRELDALFARRSSRQTLKLAIVLVVGALIVALAVQLLKLPSATRVRTTTAVPASQRVQPGGLVGPALADRYPPLTAEMRQRLAEALRILADKGKIEPLPEAATVEERLEALQQRLTAAAERDPASAEVVRRLRTIKQPGDAERHLRLLLWAQGISRYDDPRLNPVELVELLQQKAGAQPHER